MTKHDDQFHRMFRKRKRIGWTLIAGPRALVPPKAMTDHGWFEQDLRITLQSNPSGKIESIVVYTDDTMNKEEDFFAPVLRHCVWDQTDNSSENGWPNTEIKLGSIKDQSLIHDCLTHIQASVGQMPFPTIGLSVTRDVPDVKHAVNSRAYSLYLRNGIQAIEYNSWQLEDDPFASLIFESYDLLVSQREPMHKTGWTERYDHDFKSDDFPHPGWYWDYT
jgi:hypothetical protein